METFAYWPIPPTLHYLQPNRKENVVSSLFNRNYSIIINKDDLIKEKARINPVLKENGYQESIISNFCKRITNNYSLPQSQQQTQATGIQEEIRMSINIPYVEGTSEKLRRLLSYLKIRCTFYTENFLHKLLCKSLKNPNHINIISYMLPKIRLSNLRVKFLVTYLFHIRRF